MGKNTTDLTVRLLAQQAKFAKDLKRAEAHMRKFTSTTTKLANTVQASLLTAFGGVALIQGIGTSIRKIADFEMQMSKVKAISGATSEEFKDLTANALDLGRTTKFTATEIGKLQEEFARLGFSTDQIVEMTDATRKLATVADAELGAAALVVGKNLNAFNLEAEDAGRLSNVMAEAFSKSALDLEGFDAAMRNVGAAADSAGFSFEETTSLLGILVDNGIEASKAGTDLRKIFTSIALSGSTLDDELNKLVKSEDKLTTSYDQFGQRALTSGIILSNNIEKHKEFTGVLSDNNKELDSMVDIMEDNLLTDWKKFTSAIDGAIQEGRRFVPVFREVLSVLTDITKTIAGIDDTEERLGAFGLDFSDFRGETKAEVAAVLETLEAFADDVDQIMKDVEDVEIKIAESFVHSGLDKKRFEKLAKESIGLIKDEMDAASFDIMKDVDLFDDFDLLSDSIGGKAKEDVDAFFSLLSDGIGEGADLLEEASKDSLDISSTIIEGQEKTMTALSDYSNNIQIGMDRVANQWEMLGFVLSSSLQGAFDVLETSIAKQSGSKALLMFFESLIKQAGKGFIAAGIQNFANSAILQASTMGIPNPGSIAQQATGVKNIGIGTGLGVGGAVIGGLRRKNENGGASLGGSGGGGSTVNVTGETIIRGQDLVYVFNQQNNRNLRTTG